MTNCTLYSYDTHVSACILRLAQLCVGSIPQNQISRLQTPPHLSCGEAKVLCAVGDIQKVEIRVSLMPDFDSHLQAGAASERVPFNSLPSAIHVEAS